jgi:hypothetical protein
MVIYLENEVTDEELPLENIPEVTDTSSEKW